MASKADSAQKAAELAKLEAEALLANAQSEKEKEQAREAAVRADKAQIELEREREKRERELAKDEYHHVYRFNSSVASESVKACMSQLASWHRLDPGCAIEIVFNSPGGNVIAGMELFDYIQELRRAGHYVTTKSSGYAASMAGILLQAGNHRVMARESWLLIHEGSFGAVGSVGEVEDTVEWVKRISERIWDIFADRVKNSSAPHPLTRAQIKRRSSRRDWWIDSDQALRWGLCDEVC